MAIYHALNMEIVYLPKEIGDKLTSLKESEKRASIVQIIGEEVFSIMRKNRLLVPIEEGENQILFELREGLMSSITPTMMYLLLTDGCNLKCRYCFEDSPVAPSFSPSLMGAGTAEKAISYFACLSGKYDEGIKKQRLIHLYGGEPLLNKDVVRVSVLEIKKLQREGILPDNCETAIVTNGTLIDEEVTRFLGRNQVTIGLSLDGPEQINNLHRIAKSDQMNVFAEVMQAHKLLAKHGAKIGISATLTPEVIENAEEVLDFFINKLGIQDGICFNILHYNPIMQVDSEYFEKAASFLIKSFQTFRENGIYEERMMRKAEAFANKSPIYSDCGVNGNQIVVSPDGKIGVCHDFIKPRKYFGGTVYAPHYDPVNEGLYEDWKNRSPFFMEQCVDCEAIAICGGGCPASAELQTGNRWNIDRRICPHSKLTLEWLIWDLYSNMA